VVESPLDADVERDPTELLVVDRPDDAEVESALIPDDAEVEREETLLLVVDRPVDAEVERDPT